MRKMYSAEKPVNTPVFTGYSGEYIFLFFCLKIYLNLSTCLYRLMNMLIPFGVLRKMLLSNFFDVKKTYFGSGVVSVFWDAI